MIRRREFEAFRRMAKKRKKPGKITRLRRQFKPNVGTLMFFLIAVYILFSVSSYLKRDQVKFYEVEEGSIVREHNYTGLILRQEELVNAETSGYVNYYIPEGRKAAKNSRVYSIDESGNLKNYLAQHAENGNSLRDSDAAELRSELFDFTKQYSDVSFYATYELNSTLNAQVLEFANINALSEISAELEAAGISFHTYSAEATGMVSYAVDGYETLTPSELSAEQFDKTAYQKQMLKSGELVQSGTPAYKLVTSDNWQLAFQVNETDLADFSGQSNLRIRFRDKNITTTAPFETVRGADGNTYGILSLTRYLVQFNGQRLIDFEVVSNDVSGLKIPEKSVTTKDFYIIPLSYLETDENGNQGFYKEVLSDAGTSQQFVTPDIYNQDDEYCYIDQAEDGALKAGDYVSRPGASGERYQIGPVKPLEGVYNINKGYTVFKRIEVLEHANGYCIIKKNTSYGLSVYDHIVLDAEAVGDGQLIYR